MKIINTILGLVIVMAITVSCQNKVENEKLTDFQLIGGHNSYKIALDQELWEWLYKMDPEFALTLQYSHPPLKEQLDMGLRSLEIDVYHDPKGGHYLDPTGLKIPQHPKPFDKEGKLKEPGLKVFHMQDIDFRSHNLLFKDALMELKQWSMENHGHIPVIITMNANDKDFKKEGMRAPLKFTKQALDSIDLEILQVFDKEDLITPDLVRKEGMTLEQSILKYGWPEIEKVKGKFMFVLDEIGEKQALYIEGHPSLEGRVLFVNATEGSPEAAFRIIKDPVLDFEYIKGLVDKGYIVRTRVDEGTQEARNNDNNYSRFHKAIECGAQVLITDFYLKPQLFESTYKISFEGGKYVRNKKNGLNK